MIYSITKGDKNVSFKIFSEKISLKTQIHFYSKLGNEKKLLIHAQSDDKYSINTK